VGYGRDVELGRQDDFFRILLIEQGRKLGQHLVDDRCGRGFDPSPAARLKVESAWLVTADNPGGSCPNIRQRYGEATNTREITARRNRERDRNPC
jgi:hypothetical protein